MTEEKVYIYIWLTRHVSSSRQQKINIKPDLKKGRFDIDVQLLGECDVVIGELCRRLGWWQELWELEEDLESTPALQSVEGDRGAEVRIEKFEVEDEDEDDEACFRFIRVEK
jgi:hypothetical protein